jgi:REase_DpnII-MboI
MVACEPEDSRACGLHRPAGKPGDGRLREREPSSTSVAEYLTFRVDLDQTVEHIVEQFRVEYSDGEYVGHQCEWVHSDTQNRYPHARGRTAGSAGTIAFAETRLDAVSLVLALGERMLLVERSLRVRPHGRPPLDFADEYDDQYLFRALLAQFFDDIRDEEYTPSKAGKNSRIDFLLPAYKLAVELKHATPALNDGKLGEQLIIDRDRYGNHSSVTHLLCLVFDHEGHLRNPRALEDDLRRDVSTTEMAVTVRIYDR